jgi:hypothetical protein
MLPNGSATMATRPTGMPKAFGHYPPAGCLDRVGCLVGGGDKPVRFITLLGCQDNLRVAAGQGQGGLADVIVAPPQPARTIRTLGRGLGGGLAPGANGG